MIAVQDREKHNLPIYAYKVCKIFMQCEVTGGQFKTNIETTGFDYFGIDELPELAEEKNNNHSVRIRNLNNGLHITQGLGVRPRRYSSIKF